MIRTGPAVLRTRRDAAVKEATTFLSADPPDLESARARLDEIHAIDDLRSLMSSRLERRVAIAAALACVAVVLVAIGFNIHLGGRALTLQTRTGELAFEVAPGTTLQTDGVALRSIRAAAVIIAGKLEMTPNLDGMTSLAEIQVDSGKTAIRLRRTSDRCFELRVPTGRLAVTLAGGSATAPAGKTFKLDRGGIFDFCAASGGRITATGPTKIRIAALAEEGTPPTFLPAMEEGTVSFARSGIVRRLDRNERVALTGVSGTLIVGLEDTLDASFNGRAAGIEQFRGLGPEQGGSTMSPTVAETALSSPIFASITAAFAGVWGFLWSLNKILSRP